MKKILTLTIALIVFASVAFATERVMRFPTGSPTTVLGTDTTASDLPIADAGTIISATEVEGALQENRTALDLNTIHSTDNTQAHTDYLINNGNDTTSGILTSAGYIVGDGQTVGATTNKWLFDDTNGDISTTGNVGIGTAGPDVNLDIEGTTGISIGKDVTAGTTNEEGILKLWSDGDNAFYTQIKTGTQTQNNLFTLPLNDGDDGQALTTDGAGVLSFSAAGSGDITSVGDVASGDAFTADGTGNNLYFEGATADEFETILTAADTTTADKTITLPDATGTVVLKDTTDTLTNKTLAAADNVIDADTVTNGVYTTDFPLNQNTTGKADTAGNADTVTTITGLAPDTQNTYARTQYLIPYASTTTAFGEIAIGTDGQVLTSAGAGVAPAFETPAAAGATTELDNLGTVAINTSLISDTDSTDDLGSSDKYWANAYIDEVYTPAIQFPATAVPSADANTIDDYEEGSYTATITCSTSGSYTLSAGADTLAYTKIGRVVHVQGKLEITGESSPDGSLKVSLPFAVGDFTDKSERIVGSVLIWDNGTAMAGATYAFAEAGFDYFFIIIAPIDGGTYGGVSNTNVDTAFSIQVGFSYMTE